MESIDQVRQAANILELASQYTTLRQRGRKHVGLCPFHTEKTPSFTVDAEKGLYHCFGCGVGGDVFSLVMEKENLNFPEAVKYLAERYHIPIPEQRKISPQALKLEEQVQKINESALAFFRRNLSNTQEGKKAQDYLEKRGIPDKAVQDFKIGYALNAWDPLISYFQAKGVSGQLLERSGLVLPGKRLGEFYDRFRGRVIFPIFSVTGKVVGFGGRTLFDADPKYLNSPDTPIYSKGLLLYGLNFSKDAIRDRGEAILVEGYTDYLTLYLSGFTNVVASLGTALTPHQVGLLRRFAPIVTINYDGDAAGRNAAYRAVPLCFEKGLETRVLVLPGNLDPDGFLRKNGREAYAKLLEVAVSGLKYIVDVGIAGKRMNVPEVKTKVLRGILAVLENIPDSIVRSEYLTQAAEHLNVEENLLRGLSGTKAGANPAEEAKDSLLPAEKRLLQILIENKELRPYIMAEIREDDIKGLKSEPVFRIIFDCFRKDSDLILHELQKEAGPSLARLVSQALLEQEEPPTAEEALDCLCALQKTRKECEIKSLQAEIVRLEKQGEKDQLRDLLTRKQDLIKQIMALK
jgi:DNA primase